MDSSIEPSELAPGLNFTNKQPHLRQFDKTAMEEFYSTKAESMVRYSKKLTGKYFNMSKQSQIAFLKASNVLLEPFCAIKRGQDQKAEKLIRMPPNPLGVQVRNKKIISLYDFCRQRNIPFNENEQRYYRKAKFEQTDKTYKQVITAYLREIKLRHSLKKDSPSTTRKAVTIQVESIGQQSIGDAPSE